MSTNTETIVVEYTLPHAPRKVWRALTEPAMLGAWLMQNDFEPQLGHEFTFRAKPMGEWDGIVRCKVLELDEPRKLVYSWRGGSGNSTLDTRVAWTLEATSSGTRLTLEHSGFLPMNAMAFQAMSKGWSGNVAERMSALLDDHAS